MRCTTLACQRLAQGDRIGGAGGGRRHACVLVSRADELDGCIEGSLDEADYIKLVEAIEAYAARRWPEGRIPGGKG